jgi:hypothetical protein
VRFSKASKDSKTALSDGLLIGRYSNPKEKSSNLKHKLYIPASSKASNWFDFFHLILTVMPVLLFLTPAV